MTHSRRVDPRPGRARPPRAQMLSRWGQSKSLLAPNRPIRAGKKPGVSAHRRRFARALLPGGRHRRAVLPLAGDCELVRLRDVTLRYGRSTILEGIDWTVRAGESWALLGPVTWGLFLIAISSASRRVSF